MMGRHPDCDLVVTDETVSRFHAELVVTKSGRLFLVDRRSTWGTHYFINGEWKKLTKGDFVSLNTKLRLGRFDTTLEHLLSINGVNI